MKTSQLIKELQDSLAQHGDVDVCFPDFDRGGHIDIDYVIPEYAWKAGHIGFVKDKEAGVSFISLK